MTDPPDTGLDPGVVAVLFDALDVFVAARAAFRGLVPGDAGYAAASDALVIAGDAYIAARDAERVARAPRRSHPRHP